MSDSTPDGRDDDRADPQVLLAVHDLTKSYGGSLALDAVSVEFRAGEVHALLGENGAGKSTLVKTVAGTVTADSGTVRGAAHEDGDVAVVFQELSVLPEMSVEDNLALAARDRHGPLVLRRRLRERATACLTRAGLDGLALDAPVSALSLAQRQLLEIARGLMADARVLILDEPTATLSDVEITRVHEVVRSLTAQGAAVVYITHRLGEVFDLADRLTVMRSGRVVTSGTTAQFDMTSLVAAMLGADHAPVHTAIRLRPGVTPSSLVVDGLARDRCYAGVSLEVRSGEVVALFGQIGSGADDVARSLAGMEPPDGGRVTRDGVRVDLSSRARAHRSGIAYVSPDRVAEGVFLDASVTTNISSGALPAVTTAGIVRRRKELDLARELAAAVALEPSRVREPVSAFSGGNQQKVAIARSLAPRPTVLVLDEPTRGVDIGARSEIYRSIRERTADGVLTLLYSSDVVEIREVADRVITMFRGRVVAEHRLGDVADSRLLTEILDGTQS